MVTNDYNLNKIAKLQGVEVINLNDLRERDEADRPPRERASPSKLPPKRGEEQGRIGYPRRRHDDRCRARQAITWGRPFGLTVTSVLQTSRRSA